MVTRSQVRGSKLVLEDGGRTLLLPLSDIVWIEASGTYSAIHGSQDSWVVRVTMGGLEEKLAGRGFCRIHRSSIVRLEGIREIRSLPRGDALVILECGTELRLARSRKEVLERALGW